MEIRGDEKFEPMGKTVPVRGMRKTGLKAVRREKMRRLGSLVLRGMERNKETQ